MCVHHDWESRRWWPKYRNATWICASKDIFVALSLHVPGQLGRGCVSTVCKWFSILWSMIQTFWSMTSVDMRTSWLRWSAVMAKTSKCRLHVPLKGDIHHSISTRSCTTWSLLYANCLKTILYSLQHQWKRFGAKLWPDVRTSWLGQSAIMARTSKCRRHMPTFIAQSLRINGQLGRYCMQSLWKLFSELQTIVENVLKHKFDLNCVHPDWDIWQLSPKHRNYAEICHSKEIFIALSLRVRENLVVIVRQLFEDDVLSSWASFKTFWRMTLTRIAYLVIGTVGNYVQNIEAPSKYAPQMRYSWHYLCAFVYNWIVIVRKLPEKGYLSYEASFKTFWNMNSIWIAYIMSEKVSH